MDHNFKNILLIVLFCIGCTNQNADVVPRGNRSHNILFPEALSECSKFDSSFRVKGLLSTIYSQGSYLSKNIQLDFLDFPEEFFKDPKFYGQINLWKISDGKKVFRGMPTNMLFIHKGTGFPIERAFVDRIWQNSFEIAIGIGKINPKAVSYKNFMREFSLLLMEVDPEWEGLTLNFYTSENTTPVYQIETLIPPFKSNPTKYSKEVEAPELSSLHPLKNTEDPKAGDDLYERRSKALCDVFDHDVKVPRPDFKMYNETFRRIKTFLHNL